MPTRSERRRAVSDALKQIELCVAVFRDDLTNRSPLRSSTARQMIASAFEVVHQVAALEGSDEAYASLRKQVGAVPPDPQGHCEPPILNPNLRKP